MGIAKMVRNDMQNAGFGAEIVSENCIKVFLKSRKVRLMGVQTALEAEYDTSVLSLQSMADAVLVRW